MIAGLLFILFGLSMIYITIIERFINIISILAFQGILLFCLAYVELDKIELANLLFILAETILFKSIFVPYYLRKIVKQTGVNRIHRHALPGFYSLILLCIALIFSVMLANVSASEGSNKLNLIIAFFALFTGLLFIVMRRLVLSHLIGFLIIENSVFLFSLAFGKEIPLLINTGILLDIFISALILTSFIGTLGSYTSDLKQDALTNLKE